MNSEQIDFAMEHRLPVIFDGERYDYILECSKSYDDNKKPCFSLTLLQGRMSYRVPADKVKPEKKWRRKKDKHELHGLSSEQDGNRSGIWI